MTLHLNQDSHTERTKDLPLVSIIVPTYNRSIFLREMIESVISQTYANWELIIIDDGSIDNTKLIVTPFLSDRIFFYQIEHTGRSFARNYGLKRAKGEYIAYLDSDDVFLSNKIEIQVSWMMNHPEYALVYASAYKINDDGDIFPGMYEAKKSGNIYKEVAMFLPVTITLPSVMIRKEIQDTVGEFDESLNRFEDTDMWRRVARDYKIGSIVEPLVKVRTHSENQLKVLNPEETYLEIKKFVSKVKREDGKKYRLFVREGASRLYFYYAVGFLGISGWKFWAGKLFLLSIINHPLYFIINILIRATKVTRRFFMKEKQTDQKY